MVNKGFSLFELLVTIAAFVLFITLIVPKFNFINKFILQNEVDKLFTIFSYLQQKAIAANIEHTLLFDLNKKTYEYCQTEYKLPEKINFGILPGVLGPPAKPRKIIKEPILFEKLSDKIFRVIFYPDGNISSGSIFFVDIKKNYLMSLSCPVSPFSCIRKYKYENSQWVLLK
ncbi:MAG: prepilin-type N-terminal cleavage/methylation domain-containing protein [bacterium]